MLTLAFVHHDLASNEGSEQGVTRHRDAAQPD